MPPLPSSLSKYNSLNTWFLVANLAFSVNTIWAPLWRNGYFEALMQLWNDGPHMLPGSSNPILTKYTFIRPLDQLLTFSTVLFANVTDGSTPQFSMLTFHFTGQWASVMTIVIMEGLREGNKEHIIPLSTWWLLLMQLVTYGCGMPLYCLVHLFISSTAPDKMAMAPFVEVRHVEMLEDLPLSVVIGYGIPTVLMSIPFHNNLLHQWLGAVWQGHPLWIVLVQWLLRALRARRVKQAEAPNKRTVNNRHLSRMRSRAYLFAFGAAAVTHVASLSIVTARALFPMLFSQWAQETITFQNIYQPPLLLTNVPMKSMALAVLHFFQYDLYCGSTTSIFWAITLYLRSRRATLGIGDGLSLGCKMIGSCIAAGPSAVLVFLMYSRDEETCMANYDEEGKNI